jgi:hypothetical protein
MTLQTMLVCEVILEGSELRTCSAVVQMTYCESEFTCENRPCLNRLYSSIEKFKYLFFLLEKC